MSRLFWTILGFFGGVVIAQNADNMSSPAKSAILFAVVAACGLTFFCGYRGKTEAVATAVAQATATANANADAKAQSIANSAINLYLGTQAGISPEMISSITDRAVESITNVDRVPTFETMTDKEYDESTA